MRATVFHGVNDIRVEEVERPRAGVGEAVSSCIGNCCRGGNGLIATLAEPVVATET